MDDSQTVSAHVRCLTVNLDDEDVTLFDGRWPVPNGVALHTYLIRGDRALVVDPWDAGGYGPEEVQADLQGLDLEWEDVTAVAFTRQPAADLVARLLALCPGIDVWGLPTMGARYELGAGVSVESREGFWFVVPDGVALTGDVFAGLGWVDELWADDLNENEARWFDDEALRWFAGRPLVPAELPTGTRVVAPLHGCLWGKTPEAALDRARRFEKWGRGAALREVTVIWPADSLADAAVEALVGGTLDAGAGLNLFRIPGDEATALAAGARRASLVVVPPGLDTSFLAGMEKELWRPDPATPPATLRAEVTARFQALGFSDD